MGSHSPREVGDKKGRKNSGQIAPWHMHACALVLAALLLVYEYFGSSQASSHELVHL